MEKKLRRLTTPFRTSSGRQEIRAKSSAGQSRRRISSVYLSDSTYTSSLIVIPEFDDPAATPSQLSPNGDTSYFYGPESTGSYDDSCLGGGCYTSASNTYYNDDLDLSRRLGFAYQYIRSMPSSASPTHLLSSDPQILRKQLGVPQHSVLNHPLHSSPDLPNPHPFPPEPTSLKPPSAAPPNAAHASLSKVDLSVRTAVYSLSPHHGLPDSFETAQRTESISTDSSSQCHTPETPWSPRIICTLNSQPSSFKPSKLVKRRIDKPNITMTPPSLSSSRPQVLRGALRKQTVDTPDSVTANNCPISLPQIRSPSPFKVDIPLHHAWHDRRTDFNSSSVCHPKLVQLHETRPRRPSGNTEVLASLAWIGVPSKTSGSLTATSRPPPAPEAPTIPSDRFSMAIAVEDDSISDNALVDRLEGVLKMGCSPERARDVSPLRSPDNIQPSSLTKSCDVPPLMEGENHDTDSEDTQVWQVARRGLLCIREIIQTEKRYQEAIGMLLNAQTTTPPPPSMVPYISALFRVSETLLRCYLEDPSAWGISTAFVVSEDELETTMVSWCSVAGTFFTDGNDPQSSGLAGKRRLRKPRVMTSPPPSVTGAPNPRLTSMFPAISTVTRTEGEGDGTMQRTPSEQEAQSTHISLHKLGQERRNSQVLSAQPPSRKSSVRDLAIQPIQRVMRYVLLYRDLLECTPSTSPSHLLVGRALEAATRIADHCDRAQRNPAFIHTP